MDDEEWRDDIDPGRAAGPTLLAIRFYLLAVPALVLIFAPVPAVLRWGGLALLVGALAAGTWFAVRAVRARRKFDRAALRLMEEEDEERDES